MTGSLCLTPDQRRALLAVIAEHVDTPVLADAPEVVAELLPHLADPRMTGAALAAAWEDYARAVHTRSALQDGSIDPAVVVPTLTCGERAQAALDVTDTDAERAMQLLLHAAPPALRRREHHEVVS